MHLISKEGGLSFFRLAVERHVSRGGRSSGRLSRGRAKEVERGDHDDGVSLVIVQKRHRLDSLKEKRNSRESAQNVRGGRGEGKPIASSLERRKKGTDMASPLGQR